MAPKALQKQPLSIELPPCSRERRRERRGRAQQEVERVRAAALAAGAGLRDEVGEQRLKEALAAEVGQGVLQPLPDEAFSEKKKKGLSCWLDG